MKIRSGNISLQATVLLALVIMALLSLYARGQDTGDPTQAPAEHGGSIDLKALNASEDYIRTADFVTMRDGVKIAVDVYLPTETDTLALSGEPFPVIFEYTPYHRSSIDLQTGKILFPPVRKFFLQKGYAYVAADMRGTGASFGWMVDMSSPLCDDAKELIDWIADQEWSSGNVGMYGGSYVGWSQVCAASRAPAALKAIVPEVVGLNRDPLKAGGVYSDAMAQIWSAMMYGMHRNASKQLAWSEHRVAYPTTPVVDEDGDGDLTDEVPSDVDGSGYFDDDYAWPVEPLAPPLYSDGNPREHHYYFNATMQRLAAPEGAPGSYDILDSIRPEDFVDAKDPANGKQRRETKYGLLPGTADSGVAIYNVAGWWDPSVRTGLEMFSTLRSTNPSRVAVWPKYHQGLSIEAAKVLGVDQVDRIEPIAGAYPIRYLNDILRWYDHYLKGIENGIDKERPVQLYIVHQGWRAENEWPLARETRKRLYLAPEKSLSWNPGDAGSDNHRADLSHDSGWGPLLDSAAVAEISVRRGRPAPAASYFSRNRFQMMGLPETAPFREDKAKQVLTYTSEPLQSDTEVTGLPIIKVWVSNSEDYGDFFFYIEDVDPLGNALLVTEQPHRAGFNKLLNDDLAVGDEAELDLKPDLLWHGFRSTDYTNKVFADGAVVPIEVMTLPTAWVFKKGHKLRLSIAMADWPTFQLHPKLAPSNNPHDKSTRTPVIDVYRGGDYGSYIELPIIPSSE